MLIASLIACRCACMLNPCTWYHGMRVFRARAACETAINRDLSAHGLYFKYGTDATAQFRRGVPHKTLGMRTKQKGISLNLIQIAGTASGIDLSRPLGALSARGALGAPEEAESTTVWLGISLVNRLNFVHNFPNGFSSGGKRLLRVVSARSTIGRVEQQQQIGRARRASGVNRLGRVLKTWRTHS